MLKDRLNEVEERIERAAARAGRRRDEITLVAITKVFPAAAILEAWELGLRDFGENYIQEFETKHPEVAGLQGARFHFVGHLQSNKARRAAELFDVIQTVDTAKLARRLDECGKPLDVMIEVRLSDENAKSGADPQVIPELIEAIASLRNLRVTGLMTMPPWSEDAEQARPYFKRLRSLAEQYKLPHLSMGMSNDFEVAIEEGATHVRVGTALFGSRKQA